MRGPQVNSHSQWCTRIWSESCRYICLQIACIRIYITLCPTVKRWAFGLTRACRHTVNVPCYSPQLRLRTTTHVKKDRGGHSICVDERACMCCIEYHLDTLPQPLVHLSDLSLKLDISVSYTSWLLPLDTCLVLAEAVLEALMWPINS